MNFPFHTESISQHVDYFVVVVVNIVFMGFIFFVAVHGQWKFNWHLLRLVVDIVVVVASNVVVVVADIVLALLVVTDHIIFSCGQ